MKREYVVKEVERGLKAKLEKYSPEEICEPDMAVAGPAIEAASWRSDSEIIREMYVNLLTKSMLVHEKQNALPAFVEIIKHLSPDEAKIIKQMFEESDLLPVLMAERIGIRKKESHEYYEKASNRFIKNGTTNFFVITVNESGQITFQNKKNFKIEMAGNSPIAENVNLLVYRACCECPYKAKTYFENLIRLNIVKHTQVECVSKKQEYIAITQSDYMKKILNDDYLQYSKKLDCQIGYQLTKGVITFTNFGEEFVKVCLAE